jgi:hypothetical protein
MKKLASGLGILLLFLLTGKIAVAQQSWDASAQKAIADVEMRWLQHVDDPIVLQSILADDFIHVLPSGLITKQQHIDYVKSHPKPPQERRSFENLTVRVYGDTAIANGIVETTNATGIHRTIFTDVFVKKDGQWKAVNAQENPEQPAH